MINYSKNRYQGQDRLALDYPESHRPFFIWARNAKDDPRRKDLRIDWLILEAKKAIDIWPNSHVNEEEGLDINNILSLDQVVPRAGYTECNVEIVPLWFNKGKSDTPKQEFVKTLLETARMLEYISKDDGDDV